MLNQGSVRIMLGAAFNGDGFAKYAAAERHAVAASRMAESSMRSSHAKIGASSQKLGSDMKRAMSVGATALKATAVVGTVAGAAIGFGLYKIIRSAADFQTSMSRMQVVSHATAAQMQQVSKHAIQLGNDIRIPNASASDAGLVMQTFAKAGFSVQQSMDAARGALILGAAAQIPFDQAALVTATMLDNFSLKANQAGMATDVLAGAANASLADIGGIATGMGSVGAVAHKAGISFQDTATSLAILSNAGVSSSRAGTELRRMMISLEVPTKEGTAALKDLGVNVYDAHGKMLPFRDIIGQLHHGLTKYGSDQQRVNKDLKDSVGTYGLIAALDLGKVGLHGAQGFDSMYTAITRSGQGAELARKQYGAFTNVFKGFVNTISTAAVVTGTALLPVLTRWGQSLNKFMGSSQFQSWMSSFGAATLSAAKSLGSFTSTHWGDIKSGLSTIVQLATSAATAIGSFVSQNWSGAVSGIRDVYSVLTAVAGAAQWLQHELGISNSSALLGVLAGIATYRYVLPFVTSLTAAVRAFSAAARSSQLSSSMFLGQTINKPKPATLDTVVSAINNPQSQQLDAVAASADKAAASVDKVGSATSALGSKAGIVNQFGRPFETIQTQASSAASEVEKVGSSASGLGAAVGRGTDSAGQKFSILKGVAGTVGPALAGIGIAFGATALVAGIAEVISRMTDLKKESAQASSATLGLYSAQTNTTSAGDRVTATQDQINGPNGAMAQVRALNKIVAATRAKMITAQLSNRQDVQIPNLMHAAAAATDAYNRALAGQKVGYDSLHQLQHQAKADAEALAQAQAIEAQAAMENLKQMGGVASKIRDTAKMPIASGIPKLGAIQVPDFAKMSAEYAKYYADISSGATKGYDLTQRAEATMISKTITSLKLLPTKSVLKLIADDIGAKKSIAATRADLIKYAQTHADATVGVNNKPMVKAIAQSLSILNQVGQAQAIATIAGNNAPLAAAIAQALGLTNRFDGVVAMAKLTAEDSGVAAAVTNVLALLSQIPSQKVVKIVTTGSLSGTNPLHHASGRSPGSSEFSQIGEGGGPEWYGSPRRGFRKTAGSEYAMLASDEYVIPTESAHRSRALNLFHQLLNDGATGRVVDSIAHDLGLKKKSYASGKGPDAQYVNGSGDPATADAQVTRLQAELSKAQSNNSKKHSTKVATTKIRSDLSHWLANQRAIQAYERQITLRDERVSTADTLRGTAVAAGKSGGSDGFLVQEHTESKGLAAQLATTNAALKHATKSNSTAKRRADLASRRATILQQQATLTQAISDRQTQLSTKEQAGLALDQQSLQIEMGSAQAQDQVSGGVANQIKAAQDDVSYQQKHLASLVKRHASQALINQATLDLQSAESTLAGLNDQAAQNAAAAAAAQKQQVDDAQSLASATQTLHATEATTTQQQIAAAQEGVSVANTAIQIAQSRGDAAGYVAARQQLASASQTLAQLQQQAAQTAIESNQALAALTPSLDDDVAYASQMVDYQQSQLAAAQATGDPAQVKTAASALAGAKSTLQGLTDQRTNDAHAKDQALAALTTGTGDDISVATSWLSTEQTNLALLQSQGASDGAIATAAGAVKSAQDDLANLQNTAASTASATNDAMRQMQQTYDAARQQVASSFASNVDNRTYHSTIHIPTTPTNPFSWSQRVLAGIGAS